MAPFLKARHFSASCTQCSHRFEFDAESASRLDTVHCPMCGWEFGVDKSVSPEPADQVEILSMDRPDRWDVVAFRQRDGYSIKRIVGLPTETVEIRHGDIWIDKQRITKPLRTQLDTRVLMFSTESLVKRQVEWSPDSMLTRFPVSLQQDFQLRYCQYANYDSLTPKSEQEPIKDFYGYNQGLSRSLNQCSDIGCEFTIALDGSIEQVDSVLSVQLTTKDYGVVRFDFSLKSESVEVELLQNNERLHSSDYRLPTKSSELSFYPSIIDGMARCVMFDGSHQTVPLKTSFEGPVGEKVHPVIVSNQMGEPNKDMRVQLVKLKVFRDLFYFEKIKHKPIKLGEDEYFVIGDNVPVSRDSRNTRFFPHRKDMVGRIEKPVGRR